MNYSSESKYVGSGQCTTVRVFVDIEKPGDVHNPEIEHLVNNTMEELGAKVYEVQIKRELALTWSETKKKLLACFPVGTLVYPKEIPNQYESLGNPWLQVYTYRGPITIGWRKRVISIDWSELELGVFSDTLFQLENTTKGCYSIHAWGYDKATEYIAKILATVGTKCPNQ